MRYPLEQFPIIPQAVRQTLANHGIGDTDEFLNHCALPEQRKNLAKFTGIPVEELKHWTGIADLVRVKGIGPATATLLVTSGECGNVQELIAALASPVQENDREITGLQALQRGLSKFTEWITRLFQPRKAGYAPQDKLDPQPAYPFAPDASAQAASAMRQRLGQFVKESGNHNAIPSSTQLVEIMEEALELRPRLVFREKTDQLDFRLAMRTRSWNMCKTALKYYAILWGMLVVISLISIWMLYGQLREILEPAQESQVILRMYDSLFVTSAHYFLRSSFVFAVVMAAAVAIAFFLLGFLPYLTTYYPSVGLMNSAAHQSFFMKAIGISLKKEERAIQAALVIFILIFGFAGLYFAYQNIEFDASSLEPYAWGGSFFGALIGLIASSATMVHVMAGVKVDWERDQESFKRYLLYMLTNVIIAPVAGFIALFAILYSANYVSDRLFDHSLAPRYHAALEQTCHQEALREVNGDTANPDYSENLILCRDGIMPGIIETLEPSMRMSDPEISLWDQAEPALGWAINKIIIWMLLTGVALMFVFPYLSIGGWWRGIFYIVLLVTASQIENALQSNSASWLNLEPDATGSRLLIWFFILTSALIFDWIYDGFTGAKKLCPNCQTMIEDYAYCPICGLVQA